MTSPEVQALLDKARAPGARRRLLPHRTHQPGGGDGLVAGDEAGAGFEGFGHDQAVVNVGQARERLNAESDFRRQGSKAKTGVRSEGADNAADVNGAAPFFGEHDHFGQDDSRYAYLAGAAHPFVEGGPGASAQKRRAA